MKLFSLSIVITIILLPITASAINWEQGALNIYLSSEVYYQDVKGNEEKSTLDKDWFYVENLILDLNQELAEKARFQFIDCHRKKGKGVGEGLIDGIRNWGRKL